jgi:hypothetical protein
MARCWRKAKPPAAGFGVKAPCPRTADYESNKFVSICDGGLRIGYRQGEQFAGLDALSTLFCPAQNFLSISQAR